MKYALLFLCLVFSAAAYSANFYWVDGTGDWNDVNHWATTSGGTLLHANIPSANDDVFIDENSFTGPDQYIDLLSLAARCRSLTISTTQPNAELRSSFDAELQVHGDLEVSGTILFLVRSMVFLGSSGSATINTGGRELQARVTINGGATTNFTIEDDLITSRDIRVRSGTIILAPGLTFTADDVALDGVGTVDYAGLTITARNRLEITVTAAELPDLRSCRLVHLGESTIPSINVDGPPGTRFQSIHYSSGNDEELELDDRSFAAGVDPLAADSILLMGNSISRVDLLAGYLELGAGTVHRYATNTIVTIEDELIVRSSCDTPTNLNGNEGVTFSALASANTDLTGLLVADIIGTGGADYTAAESDGSGVTTGWVFPDAGGDRYWVGNSGEWSDRNHWSTTSGGTPGACPPTSSTDVFFDANSFASAGHTVSFPVGDWFAGALDFSGNDDDVSMEFLNGTTLNVYGDCYLDDQLEIIALGFAPELAFRGPGVDKEIQTFGKTGSLSISFDGTGDWVLLDSLAAGFRLGFFDGGLNSNDQPISTRELTLSSRQFRLNLTSSTLYTNEQAANQNNATRWTLRSREPGFINMDDASIVNRNVIPEFILRFDDDGGLNRIKSIISHGLIELDNIQDFEADVVDLRGGSNARLNGRIDELILAPGTNNQFEQSGVNDLELGNLEAMGTCIEPIGIKSNGGYTLRASSPQSGSFLQLENMTGVGTSWAASESTDLGGNTGWSFTDSPAPRTLFWVGDGGDWSDADHWSLTSGGPGGECLPTQIDDVVFDAASFSLAGERVVLGANSASPPITINQIDTRGLDDQMFFSRGNFVLFGSGYFSQLAEFDDNFGDRVNQVDYRGAGTAELLAANPEFSNLHISGPGTLDLIGPIPRGRNLFSNNGTFNTNGHEMTWTQMGITASSVSPTIVATIDLSNSVVNLLNGGGPVNIREGAGNRLISNDAELVIANGGPVRLNSYVENLNITLMPGAFSDHNIVFSENSADPNGQRGSVLKIDAMGDARFSGPFDVDSLVLHEGLTFRFNPTGNLEIMDRLIAVGTACNPINMESNLNDQATINFASSAVAEMDYVRLERLDASGPNTYEAGRNSTNINDSSNGWEYTTNTVVQSLDRFFLGDDITECNAAGITLAPVVPPGFEATYEWQDGSTEMEFISPGPGTYRLSITFGEDDCLVADEITVTGGDLALEANQEVITCGEEFATISVPDPSASGYSWDVPNGVVSSLSYDAVTVSVPATVILNQTNAGCTGSTTYTITDGAPAAIDTTIQLCSGETWMTSLDTYTPVDGEVITEQLVAVSGCDSVRNLRFEVGAVAGAMIVESQCGPAAFTTNQATYFVTQDTLIEEQYVSSLNCDSTQTYQITVRDEPMNTEVITDYTETEFTTDRATYPINEDTTIVEVYTAVNGCDSTQTYVITVQTAVFNSTPVQQCGSANFTTEQENYFITQDTLIEEQYVATTGADSFQTYTITVLTPAFTIVNPGCLPTNQFTTDQTTYVINSDTTLVEEYVAANGCDSVVQYEFVVPVMAENMIADEICGAGPYTTNQQSYFITQDTSFSETYLAANGCDSIQMFTVNVGDIVTTGSAEFLCEPGQFITPQFTYFITQDTNFTEPYVNIDGCDSLHTFEVTIGSIIATNSTESLCGPSSFTTPAETYFITQDTSIEETYLSAGGCDSTHTFVVSLGDLIATNSTESLCGPSSFTTLAETYFITQDTSIEETYLSAGGCDSIHTFVVSLGDLITTNSTESLCGPTSFTTPAETYFITQDTSIRETYLSAGGCDSTHTFVVTLGDLITTNSTESLCGPSSFTTPAETYFITQDTSIEETYLSAGGCDSTHTFVVSLGDLITTNSTESLCGPTSFTTPAETYFITQDTSIEETYLSAGGCDSTHTFVVEVSEIAQDTTSLGFCDSQSFTSEGGVTYFITQDTSFTEIIPGLGTCDRALTYNIVISSEIRTSSTTRLCGPGPLALTSGTYFVTRDTVILEPFIATSGCDSIHETSVVVNPAVVIDAPSELSIPGRGTTVMTEILSGTAPFEFSWSASSSAVELSCTDCPEPEVSTSAEATLTLIVTDANGCQGQVTIALVPSESVFVDTTFVICEFGAVVTDQATYSPVNDTTITENYVAFDGRDSIRSVNIDIVRDEDVLQGIEVSPEDCTAGTAGRIRIIGIPGAEAEVFVNGELTNFGAINGGFVAGSYSLRIVYGDDCEINRTIEVDRIGSVQFDREVELCAPGPYQTELAVYQINRDTSFAETYPRPDACDSTVNYRISLAQNPAVIASIVIDSVNCQDPDSGSFLVVGTDLSAAASLVFAGNPVAFGEQVSGLAVGEYELVVTFPSGCVETREISVPLSQQVGGQYFPITYFGEGLFTELGNSLLLTSDTIIRDARTTPAGCLEVDVYDITVIAIPDLPALVAVTDASCSGVNDGTLNLMDDGTFYRATLNGEPLTADSLLTNLPPGEYVVTAYYHQHLNEIGTTRTFTINAPPALRVRFPVEVSTLAGERVSLEAAVAGGTAPYSISYFVPDTSANASCLTCPVVTLQPNLDALVGVGVVDANGCTASDSTVVAVLQRRQAYLPTAFSPNDDGFNDRLTVYGAEQRGIIEVLRVFDRWGNLKFVQENIDLNDEAAGWDGAEAAIATYVIQARIRWIDGTVSAFFGEVALMR